MSTVSSVSTGSAIDVSSLTKGSYTVSLAEAVTTKVQPYLDRADAVKTEINTNSTSIVAYGSMQSLLLSLQSAVANLSTEALSGSNSFNARTASLASLGSTAASSIMSVSVASGTSTGSHVVTVDQLATAEVDTSATQTVSSTTALGYTGSFVLGESGMTAQTITVTSTMSVTDIVAAINGYSNYTGVSASVVSVDSSHSVMILSGVDTDQTISMSDVSGNVLSSMGVLGSTATGTVAPSSTTTALGLSGSFTIAGGTSGTTATSFSVSVASTATLSQIVGAINSAATAAGVTNVFATINSSGELSITTTSGNALVLTDGTGDTVLSGLGVPTSGTTSAVNQIYSAKPAILSVDGVSGIQRSTNLVTDVVSGLTMNLTAADSSSPISLTIKPDTATVASAISSFVTAYNTWENFVAANEATTSSGTAASSAVLFGNQTLRDASLSVDGTLTGLIRDNSLAGLGISLNGNNMLTINSTTLSTQLSTNFSGALDVFGAVATTSSSSLQPYGSNYSTYSGTIDMKITTDSSGNVTGVYVPSTSSTTSTDFTVSGNVISGASGSVYSGMSFQYSGTGGTVTITSTQGVAAQLYQVTNNYGNSVTGSVQSLISSLQSENLTLSTQYNTDMDFANNYASYLLSWYSTIETQINTYGQTSAVMSELLTAQYGSTS